MAWVDIENNESGASARTKINTLGQDSDAALITKQKVVNQASDLSGTLDSTSVYVINGQIDMGSQSIEIPADGLTLRGLGFDISKLTSSVIGAELFTSPPGGSGNLILKDMGIEYTGATSKVYNINSSDGLGAIEIDAVNYNNCASLGEIDGYRQMLETGTGRFGGSPELTFSGTWIGGARISTSITRVLDDNTTLFKEGLGLSFSGRFITGMNCDLPIGGVFLDFQESNFANDESLEISDARITRNGIINSDDPNITPNITAESVKSNWDGNVGVTNTLKYINAAVTTEVGTVIGSVDTYYPLAGTFTVSEDVHFDMPVNGEFELLTGNGTYQITGDLVIDGASNDVLDLRVTKSTNGGATYPIEIAHIRRQVNSLVGSRDVAFFPINLIAKLKKGDRVRLEVENKTSTTNVTAELDSYFIIAQV